MRAGGRFMLKASPAAEPPCPSRGPMSDSAGTDGRIGRHTGEGEDQMPSEFPDVVVTGVAMTNALATSAEATWAALLEGSSGIRELSAPFAAELDLPVRIGGEILEDFDTDLTRVELRRLSYQQKMALVLSRRAWLDSGSPDVDPA